MPHETARSIRGGDAVVRRFVRALALISLTAALVLPRIATAEPTPRNVLLVANGYYTQEDDIEDHLLDLGHSVTRMKDYKLKGTTSLAAYDLVVISEFAPSIPTSGIDNLKAAGKPILIVEYWDFSYSQKLGLTTTSSCGYAGTDTVTSIREGYDDFTSRVGAEALVYQPSYTVYGIDIANVKSNATPLYWSSASFEEVAVLVDYAKKIAATGVYDTRKYTVDAWKMFDILLKQILPAPAPYESIDDVAQAYYDSGLYAFADEVAEDLKRDQTSWTYEEAEKEAWLLVQEWGLDELWDYMAMQVGGVFGESPSIPPIDISNFVSLPRRPTGTGAGYLPDATEDERWFMGQYWDSVGTVVPNPYRYSNYYDGTDLGLGINAKLNGRNYYYMGDTWDYHHDISPVQKWSFTNCGETGDPARCDDMIVVSSDGVPEGGIWASPVFVNGGSEWQPLVIPGVHNDYAPKLQNYWSGRDSEHKYTVPTGVVATPLPGYAVLPGSTTTLTVYIPGLMVWYGTATNPNDENEDIDSSSAATRPASWAGCSFNGIKFYACYRNTSGDAVPFSIDESPPPNEPSTGDPSVVDATYSDADGEPARFIQVAAVKVTRDDFASLCTGSSADASLCDLYDESASYWENSGLLLLGTGRPYRKSGLFLAYLRMSELRTINIFTGKPLVYYWAGNGWSWSEASAASLSGTPPCDAWRRPNSTATGKGCWAATGNWQIEQVFGELSARLIRSDDPSVEPQIVLLENNYTPWVAYWKIPLSTQLETYDITSSALTLTKTKGYGPYIIDEFSDDEYTGGDITLWHTISVWDGTPNTPYGVYTGSEVIPW